MATILNVVIAMLIPWSAALAADVATTGTAALVNGSIISTPDFRGELARVLRLRKKSEPDLNPAVLAQTKKEALDTLIGRELLYQESLQEGVKIRDAEVDTEIEKLRKQFPTEEEFNASLKKLYLSREALQSQIKRGMAIQSLINSKFSSKSTVKESEARFYYDNHQDAYTQPMQVRLSHILVKFGTEVRTSGTTLARTRIEDTHRRIAQGDDFALLAGESDDRKSGAMGGDLGWFMPGQLGKSMEATAFSLEVGQVSQIVEDRYGYYILKVTERRPKAILPFEDVREKISAQLQRERMLRDITLYQKRLRKAARVEIHLAGDD